MRKHGSGKQLAVLALALLLITGFCASPARAEATDSVDWGGYGRLKLTKVLDWSEDLAPECPEPENETPAGKWVVAIFTILDGAEFPTDAFELAKYILKLDEYTPVWVSAYGGTKDETTGEVRFTGILTFYFDVPADYDPAGAAVTVSGKTLAVSEEQEPAAAASDSVNWGGYGRVQLAEVSDWTEDYYERYYTDGTPEGKYVIVIFTILDGGSYPTDALNLGRDILRLDAYQADQVAAYGATKNATTGELRLTGNMAFFFDVPTDYDPAQGTVTVSGKPVALPAE